ncbi:MAG: hypothetical protein Q6363_005780 [Candidatus Njordarchaeota archaeon]
MSEKEISKDEAVKHIREALVKTGVVIKTTDYIYALYEKEPDKWINVSLVFGEETAWISEVSTKRALLLLIDEVSKSLPQFKGDWKPILSEDELEAILSGSQ